MHSLSRILSVSLVGATLLLTACTKKPVRDAQAATPLGTADAPSTIDPYAVAVPSDVPTTLETRDAGATVSDEDAGVVAPVYFAFDRSAVAPGERAKLEAAAKWLRDNSDKHLVLEGHCDWRGTAEYNLGLGDRRAYAVKKYLEYLGIDAPRLEVLSKGSTDAKQTGGDAEWAKDRRVDFKELKR